MFKNCPALEVFKNYFKIFQKLFSCLQSQLVVFVSVVILSEFSD